MSRAPTGPAAAADRIAFADGRFLRAGDLALGPTTQALNYGTGVFEGIRAYRDPRRGTLNLFRAHAHFERFLASAEVLRIAVGHGVDDLVAITAELLRRNGFEEDVYVRPLLFKTALRPSERFGVKLDGVDASLCITALPMGSYAPADRFRCVVSKWRRVGDAAIPCGAKITGTYVNSALAFEDARDRGADDAIMLNERGQCTEATTSNLFVVEGGAVWTPPPEAGILRGVTRDSVMALCGRLGIACGERHLGVDDLHRADGCFLTGTGIEVALVTELDGHAYGAGEGSPAHRLRAEYRRVVRGEAGWASHWLHPVARPPA